MNLPFKSRSFASLSLALFCFIPLAILPAGHEEPTTNVSEYMHKKCKLAYKAPLSEKIDLEILSPPYVHFDGEPVRKAYLSVIAAIGQYHSLEYAPHKLVAWIERHRKATVRLVLLAAPESEPKLVLKFYIPDELFNVADVHFDLDRVNWDSLQDCTSWLVCKVLCDSSRSMWLEMASVHIGIKGAPLSQPGWYEMGMAELISLHCGSPSCYDTARASQCYSLFQDPKLRKNLWDFCPGCTHPKEEVKGDELKAAIELKKCALGAILYMERVLGEDKFKTMTKEISRSEYWQDDRFYSRLSSLAGFDIRKVSQDDIDKMAPSIQSKP